MKYNFPVAIFGDVYEADPIALEGQHLVHGHLSPPLWLVADMYELPREVLYQAIVDHGMVQLRFAKKVVVVMYEHLLENNTSMAVN